MRVVEPRDPRAGPDDAEPSDDEGEVTVVASPDGAAAAAAAIELADRRSARHPGGERRRTAVWVGAPADPALAEMGAELFERRPGPRQPSQPRQPRKQP